MEKENMEIVDLSTEIIVPLTGENARFRKSKIGFSSWGQPLAHFHDIYFNGWRTLSDGPAPISIQDVIVGKKYELLDLILHSL